MTGTLSASGTLSERTELTLSRLEALPPLPASAARLLGAISSERTSARDLIDIIRSDPAITAGVLRMLRRADLGVADVSIGIERAIPLLGFNRVRQVVLVLQFLSFFDVSGADAEAAALNRDLWKHQLGVAAAAELLASRTPLKAEPSAAFVCGLLHDVGKLALLHVFPRAYLRASRRAENDRICICDAEIEVLGIDHAVAGRRLAERWQLPRAVVECCRMHHLAPGSMPEGLGERSLVEVVHLADVLVRQLRIGFSGYLPVGDAAEVAVRLGLSSETVGEVQEKLPQVLAPLFELVGDGAANGPAFYSESLRRIAREFDDVQRELAEATRRLELKSRALDTLRAYSEHVGPQSPIADICAAAATAIGNLFGQAEAVVAIVPRPGDLVHAGSSPAMTDESKAVVFPVQEAGGALESIRTAGGTNAAVLNRASGGLEPLWHRIRSKTPHLPLWSLDFPPEPCFSGVILVAADESTMAPWGMVSETLTAVTGVLRSAIAAGVERCAADRLSDALIEAQRRDSAVEPERQRRRSLNMIAEMAAGAAHELHNPLAVISGRAQMEQANAEQEDLTRSLQIIVDQAHRASEIVMELMNFARPETPRPCVLMLKDQLERIAQHWRERSEFDAEGIRVEVADPAVFAAADEVQFREVFDSILSNAVAACVPERARIQINSPSRASDETVRIVVTDNGTGMSGYVLDHAFDPFFSHRPAGRGRGLGLSRAYRLAEINGGRMWIDSEPDRGTRVTVEFPARISSIA